MERRKLYINEGEDDQMEIVGYKLDTMKLTLTVLGTMLSAGLLLLVFYWRHDWLLKCTHSICPTADAGYVLLKDQYNQLFTCKVRVAEESRVAARNTLDESEQNETELRNIDSSRESQQFPKVRFINQKFFFCKKVKYMYDNGKQIYERVNIYPLKYSYDFASRQFISNPCYNCSAFHRMDGLTMEEQSQRRLIYGWNEIRVRVTPVIQILLTQTLNPFYVFQVFSICLWIAESYYWYAGCIGVISIISVCTQLIQQRQMERALKNTISAQGLCSVYRRDRRVYENQMSSVLSPGDIVRIPREGCTMHCDAVLISGNCIVNESMLTGESVPVTKTPIPDSQTNDPLFSIKEHGRHILFCGTHIIQTRSFDQEEVRAVVVRTGFDTTKGELVRSIMYPRPVDFKFTRDSYKYIAVLGVLAIIGMIYALIVYIRNGSTPKDAVIRVLDLVTIVVPPALPAAMTVGIVFAQRRLRERRIYCISPRTINVSGSIDVFCFDKTGTLTEDGMDMWGFRPVIQEDHKSGAPKQQLSFQTHENGRNGNHDIKPDSPVIAAMATCHSLSIINATIHGDPLDLKMFEYTGLELEESEENTPNPLNAPRIVKESATKREKSIEDIGVLKQFTFTSKLQRMSVIARQNSLNGDNFVVYSKGSPEMITSLSNPYTVPVDFDQVLIHYTQQGYRVIALAYKELHRNVSSDKIDEVQRMIKTLSREEVETDLKFLGLLIMENRLKPETAPVIKQLKNAKIRIIMVTGDNMLTALSVASESLIVEPQDKILMASVSWSNGEPKPSLVWCPIENRHAYDKPTDSRINKNMPMHHTYEMNRTERIHYAVTGKSWLLIRRHFPELISKLVTRGTVFARFSPDQKQQLIEALQAEDYYVGMCGDGANDCGALKTAHAGISLSEAEASVASPFTSKDQNISCVPRLISEGRCALVTSFGIFKYMAGYSITQFLDVCILYWVGATLTDFTFLYQDLILLTTLAITFCFTKPQDVLVPKAPMVSLISLTPIVSLISIIVLNLSIMLCSTYYTQAQPWYVPYDENHDMGNFCHDVTLLVLFTASHFIVMAIIFSKGSPYRQPIYTNIPFVINLTICTVCTLEFIIYPAHWFQQLLLLKMPPSLAFRGIVIGVAGIHFFVCYLNETYIIDEIVEKKIQPALSKAVFGENVKHRAVELDLQRDINFPSLCDLSLAQVMENEAAISTENPRSEFPLSSYTNGEVNHAFNGVVRLSPEVTVMNSGLVVHENRLHHRRKTDEEIQIPQHGIENLAFETEKDSPLKTLSSARVEDVEFEQSQPQYMHLNDDDDDDEDEDDVDEGEVGDIIIGSCDVDYELDDNTTIL